MLIIKEFCPSPPREGEDVPRDGKHIIRTATYASSFSHFMELVAEARRDYPDLRDEDIQIKQYGGDRISRTFGIEFSAKGVVSAPEGYRPIIDIYPTL